MKSTFFLTPINGISPTKGDKCVNEIIFRQKIISNLLNSRRLSFELLRSPQLAAGSFNTCWTSLQLFQYSEALAPCGEISELLRNRSDAAAL
jgi:hypothetical protein